ncbi:MAG: alpha/beta hydrolase [Methanoregula sp.]
MKKELKTVLIITGVVVVLGIVGFIIWGLTPLGPANEALAAMESNANVTVQDNGNYIVFTPTLNTPITGFILYPGGHIDYRSYAPIAQEIASHGYMVTIVRMPLSLAVFGIDKADNVITAYPDIRYWVVGGHSLGGSMAASYAKKHTFKIQGVAFLASYPATSDDLSSTDLKGLSIYGSNDQVLNMDTYNATLPMLPHGTIMKVIDGGNHAQFGNYGLQPGDGTATISADDQQAQAADLIVRLIRAVEGE